MKAGRPLKYTDKDVLEMINNYFDNTPEKDLTVTGLAIIFGSKQLLSDYESRDDFKEIISLAKLKIENKYEKLLCSSSSTGAIFALKNFGWTDKQEIQHSGEINIPPIKWAKSDEQPGD